MGYRWMPWNAGPEALASTTGPDIFFRRLANRSTGTESKAIRLCFSPGASSKWSAPLGEILQTDEVMASRCGVSAGRFTGELSSGPLSGAAKAEAAEAWANQSGVDLSESYAYADDMSDLPLLELVGRPVAVNPERRLEKLAHSRGWPVQRWITKGVPS